MLKQEKISNALILMIIVAVILVVDGIYFSLDHISVYDEYETLAVPAYYAGMRWNFIGAFHGYGATLFLAPLVKIIDFGVHYYTVFKVQCLFFRITCAILTYIMARYGWKVNKYVAMMFALICDLGTLAPEDGAALSVMTEIPLALITLVICFCIMKMVNREHVIFYGVFLVVLAAYTTTIHSRVLVIYASLIFLCIIHFFRDRKFPKAFWGILAIAIISYIIVSKLNESIVGQVYMASDETSLMNTASYYATGYATSSLKLIANPEKLRIMLQIFLSLMGTFTFRSFGMIWVFASANIIYIIRGLKKKEDTDTNCESLWYVSVFGVTCWFLMNACLALMSTGAIEVGNYGWLTYARYAQPFSWMVVMTGMVILYKNYVTRREVAIVSTTLILTTSIMFFKITVPILTDSGYNMTSTFFNRIFYDGQSAAEYFGRCVEICMLFILLIWVALRKNRLGLMYVSYIILSLAVYWSQYKYFESRDMWYNSLYDVTKNILLSESDDEVKIYMTGSWRYCFYMESGMATTQFEHIEMDELEVSLSEAILLTDSPEVVEKYNDVYVLELDKNEYMLTEKTVIYEKWKNELEIMQTQSTKD